MSIKRGTCATCTYFRTESRPQECRFDPPTVIVVNGEVKSKWPSVDSDDWCSHWESALIEGRRKTYNRQIDDGDVHPE